MKIHSNRDAWKVRLEFQLLIVKNIWSSDTNDSEMIYDVCKMKYDWLSLALSLQCWACFWWWWDTCWISLMIIEISWLMMCESWWCIMTAMSNRFLMYEFSKSILDFLFLNSQLKKHESERWDSKTRIWLSLARDYMSGEINKLDEIDSLNTSRNVLYSYRSHSSVCILFRRKREEFRWLSYVC